MGLLVEVSSCQKAKTTQEWLQRRTFWPSSAPRVGFRGVHTSKPWTINCGLFWRTWCAESVTNTLDSLRRSLVKTAAQISLETEHVVTAEWLECLKACPEATGGHFE